MSQTHQQQQETIEQIRKEEQAKQNGESPGADESDQTGPDLGESSSDGGGLGVSIPTPSTRTLVIAAVVLGIAFLLYRSSQSSSSRSGGSMASQRRQAQDQAAEAESSIDVPSNPENEIDKDAAVIDGLKRDGQLFARQQRQEGGAE